MTAQRWGVPSARSRWCSAGRSAAATAAGRRWSRRSATVETVQAVRAAPRPTSPQGCRAAAALVRSAAAGRCSRVRSSARSRGHSSGSLPFQHITQNTSHFGKGPNLR